MKSAFHHFCKGMRTFSSFTLFLLLTFYYRSALCQFDQFNSPVYVGDSAHAGPFRYTPPNTCAYVESVNFSHKNGTDFTININQSVFGVLINFTFSPKKIGLQKDRFIVNIGWFNQDHFSCGSTIDTFSMSATGISDSIIMIRPSGYNRADFLWDSTAYNYSHHSVEIINNIEDTTTFSLSFTTDSSIAVHSTFVIDNDSESLPHKFIMRPLTRSDQAQIYFFSKAGAFQKDTIFQGNLNVIAHNVSTNDTFAWNITLYFHAAPTKSVPAFHSFDNFHIASITSNPFIFVSSYFTESESASLNLFDAFGIRHELPISEIEIPAGEHSQKIEIGNLPSGWYLLRAKMKDGIINRNFIVLK